MSSQNKNQVQVESKLEIKLKASLIFIKAELLFETGVVALSNPRGVEPAQHSTTHLEGFNRLFAAAFVEHAVLQKVESRGGGGAASIPSYVI